ncbi:MAG TPA: hypothetical protein VN711_00100 [Candidatus Saccharimonadales bacterium]|nr:hypothetical protein [Candidatus Saccharimonadales bacterium]
MREGGYRDISFLAKLLEKKAMLEQLGEQQGIKTEGVQEHVQDQIRQASAGNPFTGEGVTKADGTIQID